jgi:hypothetical protein
VNVLLIVLAVAFLSAFRDPDGPVPFRTLPLVVGCALAGSTYLALRVI